MHALLCGVVRYLSYIALVASAVIIVGMAVMIESDSPITVWGVFALGLTSVLTFGLFAGIPFGIVLGLVFLSPLWDIPLCQQIKWCLLSTLFIAVPFSLMDVCNEILTVALVAPFLCLTQAAVWFHVKKSSNEYRARTADHDSE